MVDGVLLVRLREVEVYGALQIGTPTLLSSEESASRKVEALPPVDLERAWNFYKNKLKGG